ncbi:MOSC domain-containing protein [Paenibacillus sp. NPDC058071]|uniref:MOSC domain-containing protein n=1 Tax=Paenibacillus sp. NPDC058071 TaxID=3346326 RepID=UPI0036DFA108
MPHSIGQLTGINRYIVKSMAGEPLEQCKVEHYGLYGDRSHAFVDENESGWERYITAREVPSLLGYEAHFEDSGDNTAGNVFPPVRITSRENGQSFEWDMHLLQQLQGQSRRPMSLLRCTPSDDLLAVDAKAVLIVTDRTLKKLSEKLGRPIDPRRFRANFIVALSDDRFEEEQRLLGKRLRIGGAEMLVDEECERCSLITLDPDNFARDKTVLRTVHEAFRLRFGVYASIAQPGLVKTGDSVWLLDE